MTESLKTAAWVVSEKQGAFRKAATWSGKLKSPSQTFSAFGFRVSLDLRSARGPFQAGLAP
jgi:hypothetical protein